MSICLIGFLIGWFRRTQHYHHLVDFIRIRDFTWRVSNCEELLVGLFTGVDGGVDEVGELTILND